MKPNSSEEADHRMKKQEYDRTRYKYCCRKCKHTEKGRKSCVCVVPMTQRRTNLIEIGCQTCGCHGCSVEDFSKRGEDPEFRPKKIQRAVHGQNQKNICCKKCTRYSGSKPCMCQLPRRKRRGRLPASGCKVCNCQGCKNYNREQNDESNEESSSISYSKSKDSSSVSVEMNEAEYNLNNMDKSVLGTMIRVEYNIMPAMLGMGVPQRTASYILGKPL